MTTDPATPLERIREILKRAREAAPEGPGLMPQPGVPQEPPVKPWCDVDDDEDNEGEGA